MPRLIKISLFSILLGIGLVLFFHFYAPYERLGQRMEAYIADQPNAYFSIREIRPSFPNKIELEGILLDRVPGINRYITFQNRLTGTFSLFPLLRGNLFLQLKGKMLGGNAEIGSKYFKKYEADDPSDDLQEKVLQLQVMVRPVTVPFFKVQKVIMPLNKDSTISGKILYTAPLTRFQNFQLAGSQYTLLLNGVLQLEKGWSESPLQIDLTYKTAKGIRLSYGGLMGKQQNSRVRFLNRQGDTPSQNQEESNGGPVINIHIAQSETRKTEDQILGKIKGFITELKNSTNKAISIKDPKNR